MLYEGIQLGAVTAAWLLAQAAVAQEDPNNTPFDEGVVVDLPEARQIHYPPETLPTTGPWQIVFEENGRRFVRLEFSDVQPGAREDYNVVIKDAVAARVFEYQPERFRSGTFWTGLIPGDTALIEVHGSPLPRDLRFSIKQVVLEQEGQRMLSIIEPNDFQPVHRLGADVQPIANGVVKLSFVRAGRSKTCSGFLVSVDTLLTNEHCVNSQSVCDTTVALFGYQETPNGDLVPGAQYECLKYEKSEYKWDFSLLKLAGRPGDDGWEPLRLCDRPVEQGEQLMLIQHPSGRPKEYVEGCEVKAAKVEGRRNVTEKVDLSHDCDSERGSSGSPVLDAKRDVVAIHHLGFGRGDFRDVNRAASMEEMLPQLDIQSRCTGG